MSSNLTQSIESWLKQWQSDLIAMYESFEPQARFMHDEWTRAEGGGGTTCVLKQGEVFEQAGVGFSQVFGHTLPAAALARKPEIAGKPWQAMGVSLVIHPRNPYAPTSHANLRYFQTVDGEGDPVWWFGGGFDLTPFYPFDEDIALWHQAAKQACDTHHPDFYQTHKDWCDQYFYLPHREETRGVGGLFFDDLTELGQEGCFAYIQDVGNAYLNAYQTIIQRRKDTPYDDRQRQFQLYRRGRYVEFNLLHDRGTAFGLQSKGRTESILMSLPPAVRFEYRYEPEAGSEEARLADYLTPRDWLALT